MTIRAPFVLRRLRSWSAIAFLSGVTLTGGGCSLIPTWDDVRTATTTVKDQVSGKARQDRLNKMYAEARLIERRKDYAGAETLYRELLKEEPQSRDCYHRLGVIAAVQGKYDLAHQHYQAALQCSTPTPDLWSDAGYCFHLQNKETEAEQALRQALVLDPTHRAALNNLALVVGEQGRIDEAYELFCKGNSEAEAEQNMGFLCAACGELDRAQQHFSRALSANPSLKPAAEALIQVTQAMQQREDYLASQGIAPGTTVGPDGVAQVGAQAQSRLDPNVVQAGGASDSQGGVRQTAAQGQPGGRRRLIEVYTGGPRRSVLHAAAAASTTTQDSESSTSASGAPNTFANAAPVPQPQPARPAGAAQPPGGMMPLTAGGAFHYPSMPQPQYLQPTSAPLTSGSGGANAPHATSSSDSAPPSSFPSLIR